jgi:hypothetical protein
MSERTVDEWPFDSRDQGLAQGAIRLGSRESNGGSAWESNPARPRERRQRPVLKTGRATGPRSLP